MRVLFRCPACDESRSAELGPETEGLECPRCHWNRPVRSDDLDGWSTGFSPRTSLSVDMPAVAPPPKGGTPTPRKCVICGCDDLWRQKDFPQELGLALVALGAVVSTVAWAYYMPATALGVLLAFALGDLVLFLVMKDVLVCYRCQARYRDASLTDDDPRFNLETAERYRQEAARLENSRAAGSPP